MENSQHDNRASLFLTGIVALVATLILVLYWPAQANGFVWDDWDYLLNPDFLDPHQWAKILQQPLVFSENYFRPLALATLMFEAYLHAGAEAHGMHITNLLLHALNSALVVVLGYQVARRVDLAPHVARTAGLIAGLLYGSHPALVEVVAWVSGRFDLLLTTFLLSGLIVNGFVHRPVARAVLVGLLFLAAAATKEMAVAFPLVVICWNLSWSPRENPGVRQLLPDMKRRGELAVYLSLLAAGVLYLLLREASLGYLYRAATMPSTVEVPGLLQKILLPAEALIRYVAMAAAPYTGTSLVHPHPLPVPLSDALAWFSVVALAGLGVTLVVLMRGRHSRVGWMWAAFFVSLLPVLHVIPLSVGNNIIQDRYLTFPLALFYSAALVTAAAFWPRGEEESRARGKRQIGVVVLLLLFVGNLISIRQTLPSWRDDLSLWLWASQRSPDSIFAQANLSDAYLKAGQSAAALTHAQKAIELSPISPAGWGLGSKALARLGEAGAAAAYEKTALSLLYDKPSAEEYCNVASAFMSTGRYREAKKLMLSVYPEARTNPRVTITLGILSSRLGEVEAARGYFSEARARVPAKDLKRFDAEIGGILAASGSGPAPK